MSHSKACLAETTQIDQLRDAFDALYPHHCRACDGLGANEWSDRDVGIYSAFEPCTSCEGVDEGAVCALCGQPGDFSSRTLSFEDDDIRPCGCPTNLQKPWYDGPCPCLYGQYDEQGRLIEREPDHDQDGVPITDEDYDFARDDFNYDAAREQAATRAFRGRD